MKALFISTVSAVFAAVNVFAVPGKPYTHLGKTPSDEKVYDEKEGV